MKQPVKRLVSAFLIVMLCISLLSGLTFAANVNYKTGNPGDFENVILNWGTRGTDATFLSPNAEAFYDDNNITYEELAELSGSSNVSSVPNSGLYQALQKLMRDNHAVITSYADTRPLYSYTDCQESSRDKMTCFYSGKSIGPDWDYGASWNREHTWPNSKGMEGSDEDDIMMLRPASSNVNSSRGNNAYGESSGFYDPNSTSNGVYNLHGDVARIFLYVYVRWGNTANPWGTEGVIENKDVLLKWMEEDPVDTWEMGRNDSVESITGTRNVFVDYPELAFDLFNEELPSTMTTPSGIAINSGITYTITPQSNNTAWGTVSLTGKTINAVPAAGYRVAGYTVVSGNASVVRNGNAFTVDADSDCTIRINFEARKEVTITYMENGSKAASVQVYADDVYTLPQYSATEPEGYSFQGWVTSAVAETTTKPATIHTPGKNITAEADVTYYALYTRLDTTSGGNSTAYKLFTGALEEGNYLITYDNGAMVASIISSTKKRMNIMDVTPDANGTIDDPDASIIWKIEFEDDGTVTVYNEAAGSYVGGSGVKSQAVLLNYISDYAKWNVTGTEAYLFENVGNSNKEVNCTLRRYTINGFACYHSSVGGDLILYKQASGTVYYSTSAVICEHVNTRTEAAVAPDCENVGYTAGVFCEDCRTFVSGHEEIAALGHSYESVVTPPTATEDGYTTYTCTVCGYHYDDDFVEALGEQYTVSFEVPAGVSAIADQICGKDGITLPTAEVPSSDIEYRFVGWTTTDHVEKSTEAPQILTGTYKATEDITLYALYSYTEGGSGAAGWKLVTSSTTLAAGDQVVLASHDKGKVAADLSSQYLGSTDAVFSENYDTITQLPDTALILTLGKSDDGFWTLTNKLGNQLGGTTVKKLAWDNGVTTWTITVDELDDVTLASTDEAYGRFLYNVNSPRFTTYTSKTSSSMLMPQLYKLEGDLGTTYYTTYVKTNVTVTISGSITSAGEGDATIQLDDGFGRIYTPVVENGRYTFTNIAPGEYMLTVRKANHVIDERILNVGAEDVELDLKICLLGDVTGDGKVNMADVARAFAHVRGKNLITDDYTLRCADATGDGKINMADIARIFAHVRGKNPLF